MQWQGHAGPPLTPFRMGAVAAFLPAFLAENPVLGGVLLGTAFGAGLVTAFYYLAVRHFGHPAAFTAVFLIVLSPGFLLFLPNHIDPLWPLLLLLALILLLELPPPWRALAAVAVGAALLVKSVAVLFVPPLILVAWVGRTPRLRGLLVGAGALSVLLGAAALGSVAGAGASTDATAAGALPDYYGSVTAMLFGRPFEPANVLTVVGHGLWKFYFDARVSAFWNGDLALGPLILLLPLGFLAARPGRSERFLLLAYGFGLPLACMVGYLSLRFGQALPLYMIHITLAVLAARALLARYGVLDRLAPQGRTVRVGHLLIGIGVITVALTIFGAVTGIYRYSWPYALLSQGGIEMRYTGEEPGRIVARAAPEGGVVAATRDLAPGLRLALGPEFAVVQLPETLAIRSGASEPACVMESDHAAILSDLILTEPDHVQIVSVFEKTRTIRYLTAHSVGFVVGGSDGLREWLLRGPGVIPVAELERSQWVVRLDGAPADMAALPPALDVSKRFLRRLDHVKTSYPAIAEWLDAYLARCGNERWRERLFPQPL